MSETYKQQKPTAVCHLRLSTLLRFSLLSVVCGLWSLPALAFYETNTINVVSNWVDNVYYYIGYGSHHDALIINSGGVFSNAKTRIGWGIFPSSLSASNNSAVVNGGVWYNQGISLGRYGARNSMTISNGGKVVSQINHSWIGENTAGSASNMVLVTGSGSVWSNQANLYIGDLSRGNSLTIINGGVVVNSGTNTVIGNTYSFGDSNSVLVSGAGSVWRIHGYLGLTIGADGRGNSLTISNGGAVLNDTAATIGSYGASNHVLVTGAGSVWSNKILRVGLYSHNINANQANSLTISNGGVVVNDSGTIGWSSSGNRVLVSGSGSVWSNQSELTVGLYGHRNSLTIANGGAVVSSNGYVGGNQTWTASLNPTSNNTVLVSGTGSVWTNRNNLFVGGSGAGNTLTITNGGKVFADNVYLSQNNQINIAGGTLYADILQGAGVVNGTSGGLNLAGVSSVTASNGELVLAGAVSGAGAYTAVSNSTLTFARGGSINSLFNTNGTIRLNGGVLTNTTSFVNGGRLWLNGGDYFSSAIVSNPLGSHLVFNGGTINATLIDLGGTNITANASFTANALSTLGLDLYVHTGATVTVSGNMTNSGAISMLGGTLAANNIVNSTGGVVVGSGTVNLGEMANAGVMYFNGATVSVAGVVYNSGTFTALNGTTKFKDGFVSSGAMIFDPTTNIIQNTATITTSGYMTAGVGDLFIFTNGATHAASFVNLSTQSNQFNTSEAHFIFDNTLSLTQNFFTAGKKLGPSSLLHTQQITAAQFAALGTNNFSLGTLEIGNNLGIWDSFLSDGFGGALYVSNLVLGVNSQLLIGSNTWVYYVNYNSASGAGVTFADYELTIASVVPEPNVALLWVAGAATAYSARRRHRRMTRAQTQALADNPSQPVQPPAPAIVSVPQSMSVTITPKVSRVRRKRAWYESRRSHRVGLIRRTESTFRAIKQRFWIDLP